MTQLPPLDFRVAEMETHTAAKYMLTETSDLADKKTIGGKCETALAVIVHWIQLGESGLQNLVHSLLLSAGNINGAHDLLVIENYLHKAPETSSYVRRLQAVRARALEEVAQLSTRGSAAESAVSAFVGNRSVSIKDMEHAVLQFARRIDGAVDPTQGTFARPSVEIRIEQSHNERDQFTEDEIDDFLQYLQRPVPLRKHAFISRAGLATIPIVAFLRNSLLGATIFGALADNNNNDTNNTRRAVTTKEIDTREEYVSNDRETGAGVAPDVEENSLYSRLASFASSVYDANVSSHGGGGVETSSTTKTTAATTTTTPTTNTAVAIGEQDRALVSAVQAVVTAKFELTDTHNAWETAVQLLRHDVVENNTMLLSILQAFIPDLSPYIQRMRSVVNLVINAIPVMQKIKRELKTYMFRNDRTSFVQQGSLFRIVESALRTVFETHQSPRNALVATTKKTRTVMPSNVVWDETEPASKKQHRYESQTLRARARHLKLPTLPLRLTRRLSSTPLSQRKTRSYSGGGVFNNLLSKLTRKGRREAIASPGAGAATAAAARTESWISHLLMFVAFGVNQSAVAQGEPCIVYFPEQADTASVDAVREQAIQFLPNYARDAARAISKTSVVKDSFKAYEAAVNAHERNGYTYTHAQNQFIYSEYLGPMRAEQEAHDLAHVRMYLKSIAVPDESLLSEAVRGSEIARAIVLACVSAMALRSAAGGEDTAVWNQTQLENSSFGISAALRDFLISTAKNVETKIDIGLILSITNTVLHLRHPPAFSIHHRDASQSPTAASSSSGSRSRIRSRIRSSFSLFSTPSSSRSRSGDDRETAQQLRGIGTWRTFDTAKEALHAVKELRRMLKNAEPTAVVQASERLRDWPQWFAVPLSAAGTGDNDLLSNSPSHTGRIALSLDTLAPFAAPPRPVVHGSICVTAYSTKLYDKTPTHTIAAFQAAALIGIRNRTQTNDSGEPGTTACVVFYATDDGDEHFRQLAKKLQLSPDSADLGRHRLFSIL